MKVAITYQHSLELGGAERVLEVLAEMYPSADLFCMVLRQDAVPKSLRGRSITPSLLNRIPGARRFYTYLQILGPAAAARIDLSEYDLVISSDGSHTLGVTTGRQTVHVCYCHSPQRSLWDKYRHYCKALPIPMRWLFMASSEYVRRCNYKASQNIDYFVANSRYVAKRIDLYYQRPSEVIYPPVNTRDAYLSDCIEEYYLSVGRLSSGKRLDLLIDACNWMRRKLVICGTGEEERRLKAIAGPTITFLGRVSDEDLASLYARCRAFLFAADEDFGIVPVEAQAFGRPVIAYGHGGSLETVRVNDGKGHSDTGVFFAEQSVPSVISAIHQFEAKESHFIPKEIQQHARQFDGSVFVQRMRDFVEARILGLK